MNLYQSKIYMEEIKNIAALDYDWEQLKDKRLAISGGTGMIGSFLTDVLMQRNRYYNQNTKIYVFGRNPQKAKERFEIYEKEPCFRYIHQDINYPVDMKKWNNHNIDYIIHAASPTHPLAYAEDPIGTITANVIGLDNLLTWGSNMDCQRFVFLSSVEIYGESRESCDVFDEKYMGYIDCNTLRAGYPESKRAGEALCQAYRSRKNMDIVIPRLARVYGPTMLMSDSKAISQFIKKGINGQNIVLKSNGSQYYSYSYVADAASAIIMIMLRGVCGEAYNVSSEASDIRLKKLAEMVAGYAGTEIVYERPSDCEAAGYSKATTAVLSTEKLRSLGWKSLYTMEQGLRNTMEILRGK